LAVNLPVLKYIAAPFEAEQPKNVTDVISEYSLVPETEIAPPSLPLQFEKKQEVTLTHKVLDTGDVSKVPVLVVQMETERGRRRRRGRRAIRI
jgi:hypothetical protein